MADDLMNIDADGPDDDESWGTWLLGVLVVVFAAAIGLWVLSIIFNWVFGLIGWLFQLGLVALGVYLLYRAVKWMFSSDDQTDHTAGVSEPSISADDEVTLGEEPDVGDVTADDLDLSGDKDLEREFEELERNISDDTTS